MPFPFFHLCAGYFKCQFMSVILFLCKKKKWKLLSFSFKKQKIFLLCLIVLLWNARLKLSSFIVCIYFPFSMRSEFYAILSNSSSVLFCLLFFPFTLFFTFFFHHHHLTESISLSLNLTFLQWILIVLLTELHDPATSTL